MNDHIHFYLHHNTNTKRGIIIGFYLRALRICSPKYLNDEFNYMKNYFLNLLKPKPFIHSAESKTLKIHNRNRSRTAINTPSNKIKLPHKHIILLNNSSTNIIRNNLNKIGIKTVTFSCKTIRDLLYSISRRDVISDAGLYCISCKNCKLKYIGETARNVQKRIFEHKRDIRLGNLNNALFLHIYKSDYNFDFNAATKLAHIHQKRLREIFEADAISLFPSTGFFNASLFFRKTCLE